MNAIAEQETMRPVTQSDVPSVEQRTFQIILVYRMCFCGHNVHRFAFDASQSPDRHRANRCACDGSLSGKAYKTYSWFSTASIVHDTFGRWEPLGFDADKEIRYLIDTELHKHDMTFADTTADVLVVYAAGVDMDY